MFANAQEADAVIDGPFGRMMLDKLDAKNMHGLAYWELGFRNITNSKRPINKMEDIAGLKLRVQSPCVQLDTVSALGANPTPMAFPEVYTALDQKAIDGQENPFTVISANKLVRGAEVRGGHQPPVQPAVGDHRQEALGLAFRRREEDPPRRGRRNRRLPAQGRRASRPALRWTT